jgi:hypothetical protein
MLKDAIIKPSNSSYSSPAILVRKKYDPCRMCIDYMELKTHKLSKKFSILVMKDLLDDLHGAQIFTKLDLRSGLTR